MDIDTESNESCAMSIWNVMGEEFELETKYKVTDYLGAGAYGVVCSVYDESSGKSYAIKKCKKIFHSRTLAKRTLREIRLLRLMNHENVISIRDIMIPKNESSFESLYVVFELMESDLAQIIRSPQKLTDQHVQYFTYQMMASLKYLHETGIVHRDLKPRNILVNGNCLLKLADFGLARIYDGSNSSKIIAMTEYITTRWYRAPEILVGWSNYGAAIDLWAAGCIIGELIGRSPMFPGSDSLKQIQLIVQCLGKPDNAFIENCRKPFYK
jgi:serine/threonine protein kinase